MTQLSEALSRALKNRGNWSYRTIERKMQDAGHNVSFSTIGVYLRGDHGTPKEDVLAAFAAILPELSIVELRRLAALPAGELGEWRPPAESARLSQEQRDALDRLIRTIVTVSPATASVTPIGAGRKPGPSAPVKRAARRSKPKSQNDA